MSGAVARHCLQLGTGGKVITIRMCILYNVVQKNTIYFEHLRTSYSSGGQCFYVKRKISSIDNLDSVLLSESGQSFCLLIIDGWSMLVPCSHCL